ncbi:DNA-processing protein DprA [Catenuloplanes indicus]|uniref:Rossmann fold nucleotide-binding protein DprA/Smf involved in DNA uptake n=1 Tax=Catenuloplanes indicus TaxID=137267 RepID=A0AAE3VTK4_9ACTN|nr:DNA-processing protein DprA [Catenuloplanes indicus]MDQ0363402.1 putative Rossmann fold nucleotide-binding protein DprA/Smf involved in DNA uptake [Catenuloplanes indicus]
MTWPAVALTGHRDLGDATDWVAGQLADGARRLADQGTTVGASGMALGADTLWARAVLAAGMQLHAVIPFEAQADRWTPEQQAQWLRLRGLAARETVCGPNPRDHVRATAALHYRNQVLIAAAEGLVVVWDGRRRGGTWSALLFAATLHHEVVWIDPVRRQTIRTAAAALAS